MSDLREIFRRHDFYREPVGSGRPVGYVHCVYLDEDGGLRVVAEEKGSTPVPAYFKRWLLLACVPDGAADLSELLKILGECEETLLPLIRRGHGTIWNGENYVGTLTEEADVALDEVRFKTGDVRYPLFGDAGEWLLADGETDTLRELARSSRREEEVEAIQADALSDGVYLHRDDVSTVLDSVLVKEVEDA